MSTPLVVIGLGNPILGDDAVGWHVLDRVRESLGPEERERVHLESLATGGLALMERLVGFRRAVLIDAAMTEGDPVGTVRCRDLESIPGAPARHLDSAHDARLVDALAAGRALGAQLPDEISIVSIEAAQVLEFSERMTPEVAAAVPAAAALVLDAIRR